MPPMPGSLSACGGFVLFGNNIASKEAILDSA
jgi:hypothetical protein